MNKKTQTLVATLAVTALLFLSAFLFFGCNNLIEPTRNAHAPHIPPLTKWPMGEPIARPPDTGHHAIPRQP